MMSRSDGFGRFVLPPVDILAVWRFFGLGVSKAGAPFMVVGRASGGIRGGMALQYGLGAQLVQDQMERLGLK